MLKYQLHILDVHCHCLRCYSRLVGAAALIAANAAALSIVSTATLVIVIVIQFSLVKRWCICHCNAGEHWCLRCNNTAPLVSKTLLPSSIKGWYLCHSNAASLFVKILAPLLLCLHHRAFVVVPLSS